MQISSQLETDLGRAAETDWRTGFGKALLLAIVTLGIYGVYVLYKLLERREQHFERMISLRDSLVRELQVRAEGHGRAVEFQRDLAELSELNRAAAARDRRGEKAPAPWVALGVLTGVTNLYVYHFLNDDFCAHEANENAFRQKASTVMEGLGLSQPDFPPAGRMPRRRFSRLLAITLLTFGIYGVFWWYTLITDPDAHFDDHAVWEEQLRLALMPGA